MEMTFGQLDPKEEKGKRLYVMQINSILGDDTPLLEPTIFGRYRLTEALKKKFGFDFIKNPVAKKCLEYFDAELKFMRLAGRL